MTLQESIKKIIKEEINNLSVIRRLYIADKYIDKLNPKDVCNYWNDFEVDDFVNEIMSEIVREMVRETPNVDHDNWIDNYDTTYDMLSKFGYPNKIRDFFNDSISNCDNL